MCDIINHEGSIDISFLFSKHLNTNFPTMESNSSSGNVNMNLNLHILSSCENSGNLLEIIEKRTYLSS